MATKHNEYELFVKETIEVVFENDNIQKETYFTAYFNEMQKVVKASDIVLIDNCNLNNNQRNIAIQIYHKTIDIQLIRSGLMRELTEKENLDFSKIERSLKEVEKTEFLEFYESVKSQLTI